MITMRSCFVRTLLALLICVLTALPASAADNPVKVFILAGQSNMVGHGKTRDGLNPEYDPSQPQYGTMSSFRCRKMGQETGFSEAWFCDR